MEATLISPRKLDENPTIWLRVPHELHKSLLSLMEAMFPGFTQKLKDAHIHCYKCEGKPNVFCIIMDTNTPALCTGYTGEPDNIETYHTISIGEENEGNSTVLIDSDK